nr:hypothetical protein CFP56_01339 [Quercus suber]
MTGLAASAQAPRFLRHFFALACTGRPGRPSEDGRRGRSRGRAGGWPHGKRASKQRPAPGDERATVLSEC